MQHVKGRRENLTVEGQGKISFMAIGIWDLQWIREHSRKSTKVGAVAQRWEDTERGNGPLCLEQRYIWGTGGIKPEDLNLGSTSDAAAGQRCRT